MTEILAPAGSKNSFIAAINAGADAVYLGLKTFSARNSAENFGLEELEEVCGYAHIFGVKVYVAMNTLVKDDEVESFLNSALEAWNCGADALIIADMFLGAYIKETYPEIKLHLSTQAGVCNEYAAKKAKELGFDRVILSRETVYEDIKRICTIIETEVFIQGALCTCFSGQCYLSSFAGGNSGNRGKCKQPCRKKYSIDRKGFDEPAYRISLSDLCVGEDVAKLCEAGVSSFKIEGRMRRPEYVSAAVSYYKNILNEADSGQDFSRLKRAYNRGNYTKGLAFGQDKNLISSAVQGHIGEFAGNIKVEDGRYICLSAFKLKRGDCFKILRQGREVCGAVFAGDAKGGFYVETRERLKNGDKAFVTTDTAFIDSLSTKKRLVPLNVSVKLFKNKNAEISVNGSCFFGDKPLESARSRPVSVDEIKTCFQKTDKYPFLISFGEVLTDGVFMPSSELNALRRYVYRKYCDSFYSNHSKISDFRFEIPEFKPAKNDKTAVICSDTDKLVADIAIIKPDDYYSADKLNDCFNGEKYLYLPPFLTGDEIEKIKPLIEKFEGIYSDGIYAFKLCDELQKPLFSGTGLNISNRISLERCGAKYVALSKELTIKEADSLSSVRSFSIVAGGIKVMDLIYCPFEKKCSSCDRRKIYSLTDEDGRIFPLRRYRTEQCRFELYNCANLVSEKSSAGALLDCTVDDDGGKLSQIYKNKKETEDYYRGNYTRGHTLKPLS